MRPNSIAARTALRAVQRELGNLFGSYLAFKAIIANPLPIPTVEL